MKKSKSLIAIVVILLILCGSYEFTVFTKATEAPSGVVNIQIPETPAVLPNIPHTDFREIRTGDTSKNQVIITIDAGTGERSAEGLLAALAKHKIKATFFLVGKWIVEHPELTRRIAREGHEIFNHSFSHPDYTKLTAEKIKAELQKMDDTLYAVAGMRTRPYYRAPFGYRNNAVIQAGAEAGFQHIYWDVDSLDWRDGETTESIKNRVLSKIHPGAIVLLHIGEYPTGDVADELFTKIEERGYKLVSLTQGL